MCFERLPAQAAESASFVGRSGDIVDFNVVQPLQSAADLVVLDLGLPKEQFQELVTA
jgi:hypothetical protein